MPSGVSVRINLAELRRELGAASAKIEKRAAGDGVRAAARVFRDRARAIAPVLRTPDRRRIPGALRRAIVVARSKKRERGLVAYFVGVKASTAQRRRGADPFYWRFLEGGWAPRGPGQRLRGGVRSRALQRRRTAASRIARPFLAPAYAGGQGAALSAFTQRFNARMTEISR